MNRLRGGNHRQWARIKKCSTFMIGAAVVAVFVALLGLPKPIQAAPNPAIAWVNRYYIKVGEEYYKDANPFDTTFRYEQSDADAAKIPQNSDHTCHQAVEFKLAHVVDPRTRTLPSDTYTNLVFFFKDSVYSDPTWFTASFISVTAQNNASTRNRTICTETTNPATVAGPDARKFTFYTDGSGNLVNVGSGVTFSRVPATDNFHGYDRYFRTDEDNDKNNSCPDMIIKHPANVLGTGDDIFNEPGQQGDVPGSAILFSVEKNDSFSRVSESYSLDSGLVQSNCHVRGSAINRQDTGEYALYSSDKTSDDQYVLSSGLDPNGETSFGGDISDDAFIAFIGGPGNQAKDPSGIPVTTPADPTSPQNNTDKTDTQVCKGGGLGWIICPVASAIQGAANVLISIMQAFLTVDPLPIGTGSIYDIWNNIRNFANIAFVFAFFAIILSQATSIGISNYGIKRLLPRLILVVIATNISYFICSFLVDAFNILGVGIANIFAIANNGSAGTIDVTGVTGNVTNVLFGSGVVAITAWAIGTGAIVELIPFVVAGFLALLVVFIILILRQALLILLVVGSPLAFVAGLLPGTQQWFTRWLNMFVGMLVMYPLVMGLFAAGRLASAILTSAGG